MIQRTAGADTIHFLPMKGCFKISCDECRLEPLVACDVPTAFFGDA